MPLDSTTISPVQKASISLQLRVSAITHRGTTRTENQDRVYVNGWTAANSLEAAYETVICTDEKCVVMVADGMGGGNGGEIASQTAIQFLSAGVPDAANLAELDQVLIDANKHLYDQMTDAIKGMGTTIAGFWFHEGTARYFNVGDSRVYRFDQRGIFQISKDDTMAAYLGVKKNSSVLLQVLGGSDPERKIEPHLGNISLEAGDGFFLCSDGISDLIEDNELFEMIRAFGNHAADRLAALALERGGHDNLTAVVITVL